MYLCVYSYFFGACFFKAGMLTSMHAPSTAWLCRSEMTAMVCLLDVSCQVDVRQQPLSFRGRRADYGTRTAGRISWSRNLILSPRTCITASGRRRHVPSLRMSPPQWVDYGAGTAFLDGRERTTLRLPHWWSAPGQRLPRAHADADGWGTVRALIGDMLGAIPSCNLGNGRFEYKGHGPRWVRWAWSSDALDFDSDGLDHFSANRMLTGPADLRLSFLESKSWPARRSRACWYA